MAGGRLPAVNGKRVVQALTRAGFVVDRTVGSHHVTFLFIPETRHERWLFRFMPGETWNPALCARSFGRPAWPWRSSQNFCRIVVQFAEGVTRRSMRWRRITPSAAKSFPS